MLTHTLFKMQSSAVVSQECYHQYFATESTSSLVREVAVEFA